jgi:hypothetical protein
MVFTAQQARDNNSRKATLDKIYEKIKIVSVDQDDLTIVFGKDPNFDYWEAHRNQQSIEENLKDAGYVVRWEHDYATLHISWR